MDRVFQEEQRNLRRIEKRIAQNAAPYEERAKEYQARLADFHPVDSEDRERFLHERSVYTRASAAAKRWRDFQDSPYFARLDLDFGEDETAETATFYIGKEGIRDDSGIIVVDWRSEVGRCYYMKNQKEFLVKDTQYFLALRRELEIKKQKLISYYTEYDGEEASLEGDVIDPFLLTVLKDKRRQNRLTDIIQTIQSNQNEIIRRPLAENFAVQGCAGSGKTMIMLHRLSYLMFQHPDRSFSGTIIITPNRYFDAYINDLSSELGLIDLERYSLEEYYVTLIKRYYPKSRVTADVRNETTLDPQVLSEIYSPQYLERAIEHYHEYWENIIAVIDGRQLKQVFLRFQQPFPDTNSHTADTAMRLQQGMLQISSSLGEVQRKQKAAWDRRRNARAEAEATYKNYQDTLRLIRREEKALVDRLRQNIAAQEESVRALQEESGLSLEQQKELSAKIAEAETAAKKREDLIVHIGRNMGSYCDYDSFVSDPDDLTRLMVKDEALPPLLFELRNLTASLDMTPVYSFGKRRTLRRDIEEKKAQFSENSRRILQGYQSTYQQEAQQLRRALAALGHRAEQLKTDQQEREEKIEQGRELLHALSQAEALFSSVHRSDGQPVLSVQDATARKTLLQRTTFLLGYRAEQLRSGKQVSGAAVDQAKGSSDLFTQGRTFSFSSQYPDTKTRLSSQTRQMCSQLLENYESLRDSLLQMERQLRSLGGILGQLEEELHVYAQQTLSPQEEALFEDSQKNLQQLDLAQIYRRVMYPDTVAVFKKHHCTYPTENFRFKLYLQLLYCALYFDRPLTADNFINIDEAQNLAPVEYGLLQKVLGSRCVFNLYGDINQAIYPFRCISDWGEIRNIVQGNFYVLNENYRNTLQITNYCNKEFEAEIYPIGISGEPVLEGGLSAAVHWLVTLKNEDPSLRTAIIYKNDSVPIKEVLAPLLSGQAVSWEAVEDSAISVVSVDLVKGLEFDAVVAVSDRMTVNETYISFTRALNQLAVVRSVSEGMEQPLVPFVDDTPIKQSLSKPVKISPPVAQTEKRDVEIETDSHGCPEEPVTALPASSENVFSHGESSFEADAVAPEEKDSDLEHSLPSLQEPAVPSGDAPLAILAAPASATFPVEEKTEQDLLALQWCNTYLQEQFSDSSTLSPSAEQVFVSLLHRNHTQYTAPTGSMKNVVLYLLALREHEQAGKQTLLTAEAYLQENELVLASQLGLKSGFIGTDMEGFLQDFKKDKYDIIFVPYEFFQNHKNYGPFLEFFSDRVSYWGFDHPPEGLGCWEQITSCAEVLHTTMYVMGRVVSSGFDTASFHSFTLPEGEFHTQPHTVRVSGTEEKLAWLLDHLDLFTGQGLIYCNDEVTCKKICKELRKQRKFQSEVYNVENSQPERINYLTNLFSTGRLRVLVTTQRAGVSLSNPWIRFILHFDLPDRELASLHHMQLGQLAVHPIQYDLISEDAPGDRCD